MRVGLHVPQFGKPALTSSLWSTLLGSSFLCQGAFELSGCLKVEPTEVCLSRQLTINGCCFIRATRRPAAKVRRARTAPIPPMFMLLLLLLSTSLSEVRQLFTPGMWVAVVAVRVGSVWVTASGWDQPFDCVRWLWMEIRGALTACCHTLTRSVRLSPSSRTCRCPNTCVRGDTVVWSSLEGDVVVRMSSFYKMSARKTWSPDQGVVGTALNPVTHSEIPVLNTCAPLQCSVLAGFWRLDPDSTPRPFLLNFLWQDFLESHSSQHILPTRAWIWPLSRTSTEVHGGLRPILPPSFLDIYLTMFSAKTYLKTANQPWQYLNCNMNCNNPIMKP